MSPSDWESIQKAFSNPREVRIQDAGIVLMNVGYRAIRADNMAVYGKNVSCELESCVPGSSAQDSEHQGKVGVIICRTHQYYILGTYDSGMYPSIAAEAVEKLGVFTMQFYINHV